MSGGFDFWRAPIGELPDSDDEGAQPPAKAVVTPNASSFSPPERVAEKSLPLRALELRLAASWSTSKSTTGSMLDLDDAMVAGAGYPVKLSSLPSYLQALSLVEPDEKAIPATAAQLAATSGVASAELASCWAAAKLAEAFGAVALPQELLGRVSDVVPSFSLQLEGAEAIRWGPSYPAATSASWRSLLGGALQPPDSIVCGNVCPVPPLPNPFTISTDCQALVEVMLKDIPPEDWDTKRFREPTSLDGLPGLCRGPGGLLASHTPKQLAQNLLAAAILNRLCGNLAISLARACHDHALEKRVPAEEQAVAAARVALGRAEKALREARAEAATAEGDLKTFLASYVADPDRQRHLQGVAGWKSSAAAQSEAELVEARKVLQDAEAARVAAFGSSKPPTWNQRWPSLVPPEARSEDLFGVRLAENGPLLYTLWEFIDAMQHGLMDRTRGIYVPKHSLEVAFVRHAADSLLLCTAGDKGDFTHLPAPATSSTGFMDPASTSELWSPQPQHACLVRLEGQTFPFTVHFGSLSSRSLGFYGAGAHVLTYNTPWNPLEYGDLLWAREAQDSISHIPLVMSLSAMVLDPDLPLGPFGPVPNSQAGLDRVPGAPGGLALLQAALFHDVKMWPVAMPHQARARWFYALRMLKVVLATRRDEDDTRTKCPRMPGVDDVRETTLLSCLEALPKVPDDGIGSGGTPAAAGAFSEGCGGFGDRLKRMELSALSSLPMRGTQAMNKALEELDKLWPQFAEETSSG
eukprot:TRINITY_DN75802_c0_g1_i1.p1 TRINITY_DN75802_c0_g1~~TRINITY_DN75802_c0_g1_i1.p1  ORF type:complete len:766 (+),score=164.54 TRINITY_DN75802_c0_g1_i1:44-2299(+)